MNISDYGAPIYGGGYNRPPYPFGVLHFSIAEASNQEKIRISFLKSHVLGNFLI